MINQTLHPLYRENFQNYELWRRTYQGGDNYLNAYLYRFSKRESTEDFLLRKNVTYIPSHATSAVKEIENALFQRMDEVNRLGGSTSYNLAVSGDLYGVDRFGSSMDYFIGKYVLPELLVMGKVGIYVDMPEIPNDIDLQSAKNYRPYLYCYPAEKILNWSYENGTDGSVLKSLLLVDEMAVLDGESSLISGYNTCHRLMQRVSEGVKVDFYNKRGDVERTQILRIPYIPFVCADIGGSLLENISRHQIALTNLASADMSFGLRANYPLYVEQYEELQANDYTDVTVDGKKKKEPLVDIGVNSGRRYPKGVEAPRFIHPSTDPMYASMHKQNQIIHDLRMTMRLTIANLGVKTQVESAEARKLDEIGFEAGLRFIGAVMEWAENRIAQYWSLYEGSSAPAEVKYPTKYSLKSDVDRQEEAQRLMGMRSILNSDTYKRTIDKNIVQLLLGNKVSTTTLQQIYTEIDESPVTETESGTESETEPKTETQPQTSTVRVSDDSVE